MLRAINLLCVHVTMYVTYSHTFALRTARARQTATDKATGTDGWYVEHLRRPPECIIISVLAKLLILVEVVGRWPKALAEGYISLIPKREGSQPTMMRSLLVLSNVYRVWAGVRLQDVMRWQETWIHPFAFGFRSHKNS